MKIKLLETFQLNFQGVRGTVWEQNDSNSTFALLCGHQEQHGTLSLFKSKRFRIPGGRIISSIVFVNGEAPPAG